MPKAPGAATGGDAELQKDVKAQLASLGFGSGGGFSDGAFDDFAPEKAKQRIGGGQQKGQAGQQQQRRQGAGGRGDGKAGGRGAGRADGRQGGRGRGQGQRDGDRGGHGQGQQRWQQGGGAAGQQQQRRSWGGDQDEAPPAPKIPNAKSILPKDEPTIWHEAASTLPALAAPTEEAAPELVAAKRKQAERLLLVEEQAFEQNMGRRSSADAKWLQQVRRSGTTADKVAAMSVLLQDGAVANLPSLDGLLAMVSKKGGARAVVGSAMDALKELFTTVLLPDRKLRFFEQQPLDKVEAGREGERRLLYWLVEDGIKKRYATYVDALEACSRDNLEYVKDRAVKALFELLSAKPEQEARLLGALVNKLGDPDRKLASKVGYLLTRLLAEHPGMSVPVVREVERFMFRPGLQERARYYAVVYLNQMVLNHRQPAQTAGSSLPRRLIDVYFTVFKMVLDGKIGTAAQLAKAQADKAAEAAAKRKKGEAAKARAAEEARQKAAAAAAASSQQGSGEMDGRMLSALITGVRRAFPYVPADEVEPLIEAHADALFRLVHARSFGVATQALLLLFQLMSSRSTVSDRFYRALYAVLGSPELYRSTKAPMFLSLLFKAIKADVSAKRTAAFAKRLLQVAQEAPGHFACGCLLLTSELLKARPALWGAVLQPEESEADGLERFQDAPEDGPAAAAGQQQEGGGGGARRAARRSAAAGGKDSKQEGGGSDEEQGSSDEEGGEDLNGLAGSGSSSEEEDGADDSEGEPDLMPGLRQQQAAAAAAAAQQAAKQAAAAAEAQRWPASKEAYDLHKREPQFSNADRSCLWELTSLATHVHPSVAAMARTLLAGQNVLYDGDPLRDLTLGAFLEKFVQKKAKAAAKGDSAMQPLALRPAAAAAGPQQWAALAGAQADALAALAEKEVRPDDLFFHKYYSLQAVQDKAKKKKKKGEGDELLSDAESEDSDAADDFLAHEEEGGDDGIGADPDRSGMDYDYANLAAAMDSGDESDGAAASDSDLDASEDEEAGGSGRFGSKFAAAGDEGDSSEGGSEGGSGGSGGESDEEDGEEPAGATFSDMSDSEGSGSEGEEEGLSGGSGSEDLSGSDDGDSDSDGGFEAELAADDLSDDDEDGSGSEKDDAAADAEVAALIRKHKIQPLAAAAGQAGSDEELNPFELAEASSSDEEAAAAAAAKAGGKRGRQQQAEQQRQEQREVRRAAKAAAEAAAAAGGRQKRKKSQDPMGVFASADDYVEMIEKDLADGGGLDDGEEPAGGKQRRQRQQSGGRGGGGRGGGRAPKRQQQAGGGGGRPAKQAKRQR